MASNQKKAVIFEVAHLPKIQEELNIIKEKLEFLGYRVILQNAQPYTSGCVIKDVKYVFAVSNITAHLKEIKSDYEAIGAKVQIAEEKELKSAIANLQKHAEDRIKKDEKEESSLFSSLSNPEPKKYEGPIKESQIEQALPETAKAEQPKKSKSPGRPKKNF